jgi:RecA/RadA recombinase
VIHNSKHVADAQSADGVNMRPRSFRELLATLKGALAVKIATDIDGIDQVLNGGMVPCATTIFVGVSGAGKTMASVRTAVNLARRGARVAVVAHDRGTVAGMVKTFLLAMGCDVQSASEDEAAAAATALDELGIAIFDRSKTIEDAIDFLAAYDDLPGVPTIKLLIVDSLQKARSRRLHGSEEEKRRLALLGDVIGDAHMRGITALAISRTTQEVTADRARNKPDPLASVSGGSDAAHDCDGFVFFARKFGSDQVTVVSRKTEGISPEVRRTMRLDTSSATFTTIADGAPTVGTAEISDGDIDRAIVAFVATNPGCSQNKIESHVSGGGPRIRDRCKVLCTGDGAHLRRDRVARAFKYYLAR